VSFRFGALLNSFSEQLTDSEEEAGEYIPFFPFLEAASFPSLEKEVPFEH
jgi:hypothetical protein